MQTLVLLLALLCFGSFAQNGTPEQIHLALTDKQDEMSVMWLTPDDVPNPMVQFGFQPTDLTQNQTAYSNSHYYWLDIYKSGAIHAARLTGLKQNTQYYYRVGDPSFGWSSVLTFRTNRQLPIRFIATGDIGTAPSCDACEQVLAGMLKVHASNPIDFVMHSGDLSYANGLQPYWDQWQNQMQPLASKVPYMASVGNHETISLWIAFLKRFDFPADESHANEGNLFYSFNYGPIHFIILNSENVEFYHWMAQFKWLQQDLASIDRKVTPWVFTSWHRPFYCSNNKHQGSAESMRQSFEDLLYQYKVDINFVGHVHAYERTKPIYNWNVVNDGIVTMTCGHGGNNEGLADSWEDPQPAWSAYREASYGFGVATVFNSTHLHWQMVRASNHSIADDWWFIRTH